MFCHKCGTQINDGSVFCPNCGTKQISDDIKQQSVATTSAKPMQQKVQAITVDTSKKKKSKKILIGIGAIVVFLILVIGIISTNVDKSIESVDSNDFLQTYTNEVEGIAFKYPGTWEEGNLFEAERYVTDKNTIMYLLVRNVNNEKQVIMNICKYLVSQEDIDKVLSYTLDTIEPDGNMMATDIEDVNIDGISARKFIYIIKNAAGVDATIIRYIYFINSYMYRVDFYSTISSLKDLESDFNIIIDTYTITAVNTLDDSMIDNASEGVIIPTEGEENVFTYDTTAGFSQPLEYYSKLSGAYDGHKGQTTLSVSIYTSQEEGETAIGTVGMYVDGEWNYFGEIVAELEPDVYLVATDTGEEVTLAAYFYDDANIVELYVDGEFIDEYWMVEHYEP